MALTTPIRPAKRRQKPAVSTPFDESPELATLDTPAESAETPEPPSPKPAPAGRKKPDPANPPFFQKVANVPAADWGHRAFMYVYCTEPICNLKILGENKYLFRSSKPILDVQEIMEDYGSMKGYITLNLRKSGADATDEMDRHQFEIYNPKYPPKIPRRAWLSDPRNERWAALLPPEKEPVEAGSPGSIVEAMKVLTDIRRDVREEMVPDEEPPSNSTNDLLATMKLAKDLFAQPAATAAAPAAKDPLEIAVSLMTIMNQQKAENPVVDMLRHELQVMREELKEARRQTAPSKSFLDQLMELAQQDKLEPIKKVFGMFTGSNGGGETVARASRVTGMEILREVVAGPGGTVLAQGVAALLGNLGRAAQPPQPQAYPTVLNAHHADGTAPPIENPEQRIQRIGAEITRPLITSFLRGGSGADFAQSFYDLRPEDYVFMRALTAANIIERYRKFPEAWNAIQFREADFIEYIGDFCSWDPNEDEGPTPDQTGDAGIVDLENEGGEA